MDKDKYIKLLEQENKDFECAIASYKEKRKAMHKELNGLKEMIDHNAGVAERMVIENEELKKSLCTLAGKKCNKNCCEG